MKSCTDQEPRKRMRKGTRSCTECRRRKIRCTFHPNRPEICNECRSRGMKCVDQEHAVITPPLSGYQRNSQLGEQPYSLRERVAHLENLVERLTDRLDQRDSDTPSCEHHGINQSDGINHPRPLAAEPDELGPSSDQICNAPILQLFDNYIVSRQEDSSNNDKFTGVHDMSPKAEAVRAELMSLLPPAEDMNKIINASFHWYVWQDHLPELFDRHVGRLAFNENCRDNLVAPAEVAKALMCLCISASHAPSEFDFGTLTVPFEPQKFSDRCIEMVDRLIVRDDNFAATLPGIECQMLLHRVHLTDGRLRKAWLVIRRAIEFAHLAGMHLSTKIPRPGDSFYERRLKIWCSLATSDRFLSLILGLPYGISDQFFLPQMEQRLNSNLSAPEEYVLRIGIIAGHMVDRNQDPSKMTIAATLRLDQELQDSWESMPSHFQVAEPCEDENREHYIERVPLQFMLKLLRAFLHLSLMLQSPHEPQFRPCHTIAIQSAREGLVLYKVLRSTTKPYLCKMIDFMAFTLCLLLIIHLQGYSDENPYQSKEQDEEDWGMVKKVIEILRQAATELGGSVAAESANILGAIHDTKDFKHDWSCLSSCKITVPYFGTITVGAGTKFSKGRPQSKEQTSVGSGTIGTEASCSEQCPTQLYTPPMSDPEGALCTNNDALNGASLTPTMASGYPDESWQSRSEVVANPYVGLELNAFNGLFDDFGQYMWPNRNIDLGLDQGWNLNWSDGEPPP
ncbi:transcriptional regulator family: Fungal Specific TF [Penicillium roqueforti]|nr:transcriptional regulator family: Fungal Specific TF [Penicillium roqueforti]KAI3140534.1 transcriptional regulator family: Fungal Specific TF [Penicillium roqueforti]